ncbi:MAG: PSD1 domain-containing protein [Pirellulaceae bacterium]|nr:PSD1 domain-containing protein [Pirellulaceae bacterium]
MNRFSLLAAGWMLLTAHGLLADETVEQTFFEERIRPVLVEHCYACHNSHENAEADLVLDCREGLRLGGNSGPLFEPTTANSLTNADNPTNSAKSTAQDSLLLRVLRHEIEGLEMPAEGPQLEPRIIDDFARWIASGAYDPRSTPPSAAELAEATSWATISKQRRQWWCFQPIAPPTLPGPESIAADVANSSASLALNLSSNGIDLLHQAELAAHQLSPNPRADPATLLRRLHLLLLGLPPTPEQLDDFAQDPSPAAYQRVVDELLESPRFGERWGRHWLDWIRYAESHGSEGDPRIVGAHHYRDYIIRSLNADIPYDQLLREHIAGDLLEVPRVDQQLGINESLIGTAHWRMVFHGFAPTDALDEKVRFTDDALDTVTKAFLALTVSCARCHDHKFDAISQADYTALAGILSSTRPGRAEIDLPQRLDKNRDELQQLKPTIQAAIAAQWLESLEDLPTRLIDNLAANPEASEKQHWLYPLYKLRQLEQSPVDGNDPASAWLESVKEFKEAQANQSSFLASKLGPNWNLADDAQSRNWYRYGSGLVARVSGAGKVGTEVHRERLAERVGESAGKSSDGGALGNIKETKRTSDGGASGHIKEANRTSDDGASGHIEETKRTSDGGASGHIEGGGAGHPGEFTIEADGERVIGGVFPASVLTHSLSTKHGGRFTSPDFTVGPGQRLWLQVCGDGQAMSRYVVQDFPRDGTVYPVTELKRERGWYWQAYDVGYWQGDALHVELTTANDAPLLVRNQPRSWFGIRRALLVDSPQVRPDTNFRESWTTVFEAAAHRPPRSTMELADLLADSIRQAILDWRDGCLSDAQALLIDDFLSAELLPNTLEALPSASPLVIRYRELENDIPVATRIPTLAEWQGSDLRLYERGNHKQPQQIVLRRFLEAIDSRPYNSPLSGRRQLADDLLRDDNPLTARVIANRIWHHLFGQGIVSTCDNFGKLGTLPSHPQLLDYLAYQFREVDHWSLKSLIRRIVTSEAWQQSSTESAAARATDPDNRLLSHFSTQRLTAEAIRDSLLSVSGEIDLTMFGPAVAGSTPRRSIYVQVLRNEPDPFLAAFDTPLPFSCQGNRDVTNVPAQSLIMINGPLTAAAAEDLAERCLSSPQAETDRQRIELMWRIALGRRPDSHELEAAEQFLSTAHEPSDTAEAAWIELAHSMLNLKEFIYVR